jgi:spermidine synthase
MASIRISEEAGVRYLHFGSRWIQGAMRVARPFSLELDYTRDMMFPLLLSQRPWPRTCLQIGLGAGSLTKFLHRHRPSCRLKIVEIEPEVATAAWHYFKLPDASDRLDVEIADGHEFIARSTRRYDLIQVDGFDSRARAGMLDSLPFYLNARSRLQPGGWFVTNLLRRRHDTGPSMARLVQAFDGRVLALPRCEGGNTVVCARADGDFNADFDTLRERAHALKAETGLNLLPRVAALIARGGDGIALGEAR